MRELHPEVANFLNRVHAGVNETNNLDQLPEWICKNTRNPLDPSKPWSFKDHEYQLGLLTDTTNHQAWQKCSQVGASEISVRMMLGMLAVMKALTAIYTLPTTGFARKFAKGRIDPVVDNSKLLKALRNNDVDSSELKQFGNSFLYLVGSFGQSSAISVPAQALFKDEVDFSNQTVLTTFNSRLGHAKDGGIVREFSTPTVNGFGINKAFVDGSQAFYTVKCSHCFDWVAPDFMRDVEVPGFDGTIFEFEKDDLRNSKVKVDEAFLRCPSCQSPLVWDDFLNPNLRQWVHTHPDREKHSYQIQPFDVAAVNPLHRTLRQIDEYERKKDWVNFKVGQPYEDAENSFIGKLIDENTSGSGAVVPDGTENVVKLAKGCCIGVDVGKTSWVVIGYPHDDKPGYKVIHRERIRQDGENYLVRRLKFLTECFGVTKGVIDAGPDFTSSSMIVQQSKTNQWFACYYTRNPLGGSLESINVNEEEGIIKSFRTGTFDELVKRCNSGMITYTESPDSVLFKDHLTSMKRVETKNEMGDIVVSWVATDDDHYAHALNYCNMAYNLMGRKSKTAVSPVLPMAAKARLKDGLERDPVTDEVKNFFKR